MSSVSPSFLFISTPSQGACDARKPVVCRVTWGVVRSLGASLVARKDFVLGEIKSKHVLLDHANALKIGSVEYVPALMGSVKGSPSELH